MTLIDQQVKSLFVAMHLTKVTDQLIATYELAQVSFTLTCIIKVVFTKLYYLLGIDLNLGLVLFVQYQPFCN